MQFHRVALALTGCGAAPYPGGNPPWITPDNEINPDMFPGGPGDPDGDGIPGVSNITDFTLPPGDGEAGWF